MTEKRWLDGRYELLDLLGEGGMAQVYNALDHQTGEIVALKALLPSTASTVSEAVGRFKREATTLRLLDHPNIIKMLDVFSEEGRHYVVMERVMGGDLKKLIEREGRLSVQRTMEIGLYLADALTRAHQKNVVHRDIKPANILLAEDGTPRLTDFGVARLIDSTAITRSDTVIGTIAYVSPEACNGYVVDARSDLWSLGVVLYEMLTGKLPFTLQEVTPPALLTAILSHPITPLEVHRPDVPPVLAALIYSLLDKDRRTRLSNARWVGMILHALLHDEPAEPILEAALAEVSSNKPDEEETRPISQVRKAWDEFQGKMAQPAPLTLADTLTDTLTDKPTMQMPSRPSRSRPRSFIVPVLILAGVGIVVVLAALLLSLPQNPPAIQRVSPVATGEYMVLVADMELTGPGAVNTSVQIVDDLRRKFEVESPFSLVRIRQYPGVVTSAQQALDIAEANNAAMILWGSHDGQTTLVNSQLGTLPDDLPFARQDIEKLVNVEYRITDPRQQSVATAVTTTMAVLTTANSDVYAGMTSGVTRTLMQITPAEVIGNSAAAHMHRANINIADRDAFLEWLDQAVRLESSSPLIYALRAIGRARAGMMLQSSLDVGTMTRLAPDGWPMLSNYLGFIPLFFSGNYAETIRHFDDFIAIRPDDWYGYTVRAIAHYAAGDYPRAQADAERAIALGARANWPYTIAAPLALRDGRIAEAQAMFITVQQQFPNPEQSDMFITNTSGVNREQSPLIAANAAFGQITLYQWDKALENTLLPGDRAANLPVLHLFRGVAECNLGMLAEAENSYSALLLADPDFVFVHLLRADVRRRMGDTAGMQADLNAVSVSPQADVLTPLGMSVAAGVVTCEDLLTFDTDPAETGP